MPAGAPRYGAAVTETNAAILPRQVLCVLGAWRSLDEVDAIVASAPGFTLDRDASTLAPDPRMERAFETSADRVTPSMSELDLAAIRDHQAVFYVLSPPLERSAARTSAAEGLALIARLFDAGASAVKCDSAGIAHGQARWRELATLAATGDADERAMALYFAFVRRPLLAEPVYHSCGMHLLGEPDVEIPTSEPILEAVDWIDTLAVYLLTEKPPEGVEAGHTFRRSEKDARRVLETHPCARYAEDHFFHNPYGYLRIIKAPKRR